MILALLTACWQPEPYVAPPPAQVEASDVLAGTADQIVPGAAEAGAGEAEAEAEPAGEAGAAGGEGEAPSPEAGAAGVGEAGVAGGEGEVEAPEAPPTPTDLPVQPYVAHTVGRPITIVGDDGAPLQVITAQGAKVTVLAEGPERVKVHCDDCRPEVEGWLQKRVVVR